jgi:hypothetical protein
MKKYTFIKGDAKITVEAASYKEALAALIFQVGSEMEAALYTYQGDE